MSRVALWESADRYAPRVLPSPLAPITFPTTPLVTKAEIALGADPSGDPAGWLWADIADYIRYKTGVSTSVGRPDESGQVTPGKATLTLDNSDGRFVRRNPTSPYYGLLSRNTPIRLSINPGDGDHIRFEGFVNEWPTRWDKSGNDVTVPIECAGILRRLGQGEALKSPLRRAILADDPVAYWPLEDGSDATRGASAIVGADPMTPTVGTVTFAQETDVPIGSAALPNLGDGIGTLSSGSSGSTGTTAHTVEFLVKSSFASAGTPIRWTVIGGTNNRFRVDFLTPNLTVSGITPGGSLTTVLSANGASVNDGEFHHIRIELSQSGSDIVGEMFFDGVSADTGTAAGQTLGAINGVQANVPSGGETVTSVGHIAIHSSINIGSRQSALAGYAGELAHVRMARICTEEGVAFATGAATSEALGPQALSATMMDVLREAEKADMGVLYERGFGLGYQSRAERYNAPVGLALDFDQGHIAEPPEPADDDQRLRNRWTVGRTNGSAVTDEDTTSIAADGLYDDSETVNVETDAQLDDQASWRVHLGIIDEDRWPEIALQFAATPELIDDWTALAYGPRVTAANPPDTGPPGDLDLFVEGHKERWDPFVWKAELAASPASPYNIGVYGDASTVARYDTAGSETTAAFIAGTDTSMTVATTVGQIWIETAAHFPFNIRVDGSVLEVTAISGGSSPQTFTITQAPVNGVVKTIAAGKSVSLAQPSYYGL